jgi:hypothetical protein
VSVTAAGPRDALCYPMHSIPLVGPKVVIWRSCTKRSLRRSSPSLSPRRMPRADPRLASPREALVGVRLAAVGPLPAPKHSAAHAATRNHAGSL